MESAHFIIPPGSGTWWLGLAFVALYGCVIWSWGTAGGQQSRRFWERVWAAGIFLFWLGGQMFLVMQGWWRFNNDLPLHLCGISNLLSVAVLMGHYRRMFVPLFFWGIVGGVHALLTPEVTTGSHPLLVAEYYVYHSSIVIVPLYLMGVHGWRLGRHDWLRALLYNNLLLIPIFAVNLLLGANYMFLIEPPAASNPFVAGDWPYYILGFELAALMHYLLLSVLFRSNGRYAFAMERTPLKTNH